jgi:prepilin signal peptidase PulO-like enzyme (type II secretory pathway)
MEVSPAFGKIIGMLMAYSVSALGLLLAYYNYRKRVLKAEVVFTPVARAVIAGVLLIFITVLVLGAAAMSGDGTHGWQAVRQNLPGVIVPAAIFAVSFWLTWLLYRHFSRKLGDTGDQ